MTPLAYPESQEPHLLVINHLIGRWWGRREGKDGFQKFLGGGHGTFWLVHRLHCCSLAPPPVDLGGVGCVGAQGRVATGEPPAPFSFLFPPLALGYLHRQRLQLLAFGLETRKMRHWEGRPVLSAMTPIIRGWLPTFEVKHRSAHRGHSEPVQLELNKRSPGLPLAVPLEVLCVKEGTARTFWQSPGETLA